MQADEANKKRDADLIIEEMKAKELALAKRENEIKERDQKIQKLMSRMGDNVVKNEKEERKVKEEREEERARFMSQVCSASI